MAEFLAQGVQAAASADGVEITDAESDCMSKAILKGLGTPKLIALAAQGGDVDSLDPADRSAMLDAITTCVAPDKLLGAGLDENASASDDPYNMAELLAKSISEGLTHRGATITTEQKACMVAHISATFTPDELMRAALDSEAGKPDDPDIADHGADRGARLPASGRHSGAGQPHCLINALSTQAFSSRRTRRCPPSRLRAGS